MGFWSLFLVASTPTFQVLLIALLGAYLASGYCNVLSAGARKDMNKVWRNYKNRHTVVFVVFTPSLAFASLARTVTLKDIISWWFMPVNVGIIVFLGAFLGWIVVKILRPASHLEGLIIAACSAGNLGNLLLIVVPAMCNDDGSPFGNHSTCRATGLSYVSFSMAIGGFYIWTHTFGIMKQAAKRYHKFQLMGNKDLEASNRSANENEGSQHLRAEGQETYGDQEALILRSARSLTGSSEDQRVVPLLSSAHLIYEELSFCERLKRSLYQIAEELMAPPTVAAFLGFIFGATPWLKNLIIGDAAPFRVIHDAVKLLGDGTIPCITLILGGNLTQGLRKSIVKPSIIILIICVRYVILPIIGIGIVKAAHEFGLLASDPLYSYVLMVQYTLPPAMNIGTIAQLFDMGQEECSVIFLWTYLTAAFALTVWSTIFMWILS